MTPEPSGSRGKYLALTAAFLGWMFDGFEMGLFPMVGRPAIKDLLHTVDDELIAAKFAMTLACFLVGAATGGVLFGWLGDRLGRVRAMALSILTYSIFSGVCGFASTPEQIAMLRFVAALGMGGEWALGVALVMEIWPDKSRAFMAGLIGAAANLGYMLVGVVGLFLNERWVQSLKEVLAPYGFDPGPSGWRVLMMCGAAPALLTFMIRLFVPESSKWEHEQDKGRTANWGTADLGGVAIGAVAGLAMVWLWAENFSMPARLVGTPIALAIVTLGFLFPVFRFLQRGESGVWRPSVKRMLLGACLSGIPLLATWASIQWAPSWADQLDVNKVNAKAYTQIMAAVGAVFGCLIGAKMGDWVGRRLAYSLLCVASLASCLWFFLGNTSFGPMFLVGICLGGATTAAFYGWLPLYLPELFPTRIRATGQGFSFNFGRILAAIGALQTGTLMGFFGGGYPKACSIMSLIYVVGLAVIWLAPETRGKPLPE